MKVSLCLILRDEKEHLKRILTDYMQYFDEVVIAYDDDCIQKYTDELKSPKIKTYKYELSDEEKKFGGLFFDRKRNFAASKVTGDYYFRLDSDDVIEGVENIRKVAVKAQNHNVSIVYCWYNYSRDNWGNVHAGHYRETIIKNSDNLFWNKIIHENVIPKSHIGHNIVIEESIKINHLMTKEHAGEAAARNIKYLLYEYGKDGDKTDPRTIAYLGRMLYSIGENDKAQYFLEKHIEKSGWDEDRYMSWCSLAEISAKKGNIEDAIGCCFEAITEMPERPDAYFKLHDIYFEKQDWKKAVYWGKLGLAQPRPMTFMLQDPSAYTWRPAISMAHCYFMMDDPETAKKFFDIAEKAAPTLDWIVSNKKHFNDAVLNKLYIEHFIWIYEYLKDRDESKIAQFVKSVPDEIFDNEEMAKIRNLYSESKVWADNEIAIFCGDTPEVWAAPSVMSGIGGSEEAVIYLSKEFTKLGYKVTVFCKCAELAGTYDGVTYKNITDFNFYKDKFNIVIAWRNNIFKHVDFSAKKKIVWLHDMPSQSQYDDPSRFDRIVVLSKYHKTLLPRGLPDWKIYISTNGIVPKDFKKLDLVPKRNQVIYASSYDRGLEELLDVWGDVKSEVPEAELHIYYGWDVFDQYVKKGFRDKTFKEKMLQKMQQPGVFEHGRVGHRKLLQEYAKSKVFAYPTNFAGEINCIAFTKAKAAGCICVTNDKYVLKERNDEYVATNSLEFKDYIVKALKGKPKDVSYVEKYIKDNSWEAVAKDWIENVFSDDKVREYKDVDDYKRQYSGWHLNEKDRRGFEPTNFLGGKPQMQDRMKFVIDKSLENGCKTLFDIGFSDGSLCLLASERGLQADGIEVDPRAKEFADKYAKENKLNCTFYSGIFEEFKEEHTYDTVCALEVLEHVLDVDAFVEKAYNLANKLVIFSVPHEDGAFGKENKDPLHIRHFNEEKMSKLLKGKNVIFNQRVGELLYVLVKK